MPTNTAIALTTLVQQFAHLKLLVVGEAMLDAYLQGAATRLSAEAPVPIVNLSERQDLPGGAANTAVNAAALGAQVTFLSVLGADSEGRRLEQTLAARGVVTDQLLVRPERQTLTKHRLVADWQMLVRFDQGTTTAIAPPLEQELGDRLEVLFPASDAVLVSDYGYGLLTPALIQRLGDLQRRYPRTLVVDAKDLRAYQSVRATAVKPNFTEALQLLGLPQPPAKTNRVAWLTPQGPALLAVTAARMVALTLDRDGALLFEPDVPPHRTYTQPQPHSRAIGAGDTYVSALTLALAAGAAPATAADLAAIAAAIVVAKTGTATCTAIELQQALCEEGVGDRAVRSNPSPSPSPTRGGEPDSTTPANPFESHSGPPFPEGKGAGGLGLSPQIAPHSWETAIAHYHQQGYRIVFTNGCFDILHSGHITHLQQARALGDVLIVGINSDESIQKLKGPERPINPLSDRMQVLAALNCVDLVIPFSDDRPIQLIEQVRPQIYVKGGDYSREMLPEAPIVEALGGTVQILPYVEQRSTTGLIQRIRSLPTRGGVSP